MSDNKRVVLVAGVHGVSGRAAAEHWRAVEDTEVYGISRRTAPALDGVHPITVDLLNAGDVRQKIAGIISSIKRITHIVFGAYIEKQTASEKSEVNVAILRNLLDAVEAA